jgi:hypothetical protein
MTVWVYVDSSKQVGDKDHLKVFADEDAAAAYLNRCSMAASRAGGRPQVWPACCAIRGRFEPSRRPPKNQRSPPGLSRRTSYAVTLAGLGGFRDCHEYTELRLTKFRGPPV